MIRLCCAVLCALVYAPAIAVTTVPDASEPIAIVHWDNLKQAKLDGTAKDLTLIPRIGTPMQIPYIQVMNQLLTPRVVKVSLVGLTEPEYDLYVIDATNRNKFPMPEMDPTGKPVFLNAKNYLIGKRTKAELESGISVSLNGTGLASSYRDYFSRMKDRCTDGLTRYTSKYDDAGVCHTVMQSVVDSNKSLELADLKWRNAIVMVVPSGVPCRPAGGGIFPPPTSIQTIADRICQGFQAQRRDIVRLVKNPLMRADALEIMTPIDFVLTGKMTPGQKSVFTATLTNWTDRVITGNVAMTLPSGWKVSDASKTVKLSGYSKSASVKFEVTPPETVDADAPVSATASLSLDTVNIKLLAKADGR